MQRNKSILGRTLHSVEDLGNSEYLYGCICLLIYFKNPQYFRMYCLRQLKLEQTTKLPVNTVGNSSLTHRSKRIWQNSFFSITAYLLFATEKKSGF